MADPIISNRGAGFGLDFHPGTGLVMPFQRQVGGVAQPLTGWGATLVAQYDDGTPVFDTLSTGGTSPAIVIDDGTNSAVVTFPAVVPPVDPKTGCRRQAARFTLTFYPPGGDLPRAYGTGRMTWGLGPPSPGSP